MPTHGAGWISGNKEVHNGKVRDLPKEEVAANQDGEREAVELESNDEYTPEPEAEHEQAADEQEHAEPV